MGDLVISAQSKPKAAAVATEQASERTNRVLLLIAITVVLAIELSGFYLLQDRFGKPEGSLTRSNDSNGVTKSAPIFVSIPPVLANLGGERGYHQLSLSMEIMTREASTADLLRDQMPLIRNEVVGIFGQQPLSYVTTLEGKEHIRREALARVRNVIHAEGGDDSSVEGVYFSSLVIQ